MKLKRLLDVDLTLFDGGAAAGGEGGAAAPTAGNNAGQAGKNPTPGSGRRAGKSGGLGNVVYGKQQAETPAQDAASEPELGPDAGGEKKTLTKEEKRAKFRELVDNEYKDIYAEEFQNAFDRRFKAAKETEEALSAQKPILDALMEKYRIADCGRPLSRTIPTGRRPPKRPGCRWSSIKSSESSSGKTKPLRRRGAGARAGRPQTVRYSGGTRKRKR